MGNTETKKPPVIITITCPQINKKSLNPIEYYKNGTVATQKGLLKLENENGMKGSSKS